MQKTVIQVFIHGTDNPIGGETTASNFSREFKLKVASAYQANGYSVYQQSLDWGDLNYPFHQASERKCAADRLINDLGKSLSNLKSQGKLPTDLRIQLLGHSHGGNVAIQSLPRYKELANKYGIKITVDLTTLNTPVYKDDIPNYYYESTPGRYGGRSILKYNWIKNPENPQTYNNTETLGANVKLNHLNVQVEGDPVPYLAFGGKNYGKPAVDKVYPSIGKFDFSKHSSILNNLNSNESLDFTTKLLPSFVSQNPMKITANENKQKQSFMRA
jgi:hypothetical protein